MFGVMAFCLSKSPLHVKELSFSGMTEHLPWEVVNKFLALFCLHALPVTLSLSQPTVYLPFSLKVFTFVNSCFIIIPR